MKRVVEPEWLDELPPEDPAATGSRADIQRLNRIMGHARVLEELLGSGLGAEKPRSLVELGGGDGTLLLALAQRLAPRWPAVDVRLVDRQDAVEEATRRAIAATGWRLRTVKADIFDWLVADGEPVDAMMANLFLHHFEGPRLRELLRLAAARTKVFAVAEPRRAWAPLMLSRFTGVIGCNAVTRHDAVLSVRAGFAEKELSELWPRDGKWQLSERRAGWTTHAFFAMLRPRSM